MIPYGCLSTGDQIGMIEVVLNSYTVAKIQKEKGGGARGAFDKTTLYQYLKEHNPNNERYSILVCAMDYVIIAQIQTHGLHKR